jgi:hypothetical protein
MQPLKMQKRNQSTSGVPNQGNLLVERGIIRASCGTQPKTNLVRCADADNQTYRDQYSIIVVTP